MKYVLALIVALAAVCSTTCSSLRAETLSPEAFTRELARALTTALPASMIAVKGHLQISVKDANGRERILALTRTYEDYVADPARFEEIVTVAVEKLSQPLQQALTVDPSRIVPVIAHRQGLVDLRNRIKAQAKDQEPLAEDYNDELVIVYAEDNPRLMRYLTTQENIGVSRQELRPLAVRNLVRILPKIRMETISGVGMISAGGNYEASLLLVDGLWTGGRIKVDGEIVVAIPSRDALLFTGSRSQGGLNVLRDLAPKYVARERYPLIDKLFVYRDGRFTKYGW